MSQLLTPGDLLDLTGTPQRKRQLEILREAGLNPLPRADGSLAISWEAVNAAMYPDGPGNPIEGRGVHLEAI